MPKTQITTSKIRKPSGHFSQATSIAARGRFVFISGMNRSVCAGNPPSRLAIGRGRACPR